jgi:hypothetical protein
MHYLKHEYRSVLSDIKREAQPSVLFLIKHDNELQQHIISTNEDPEMKEFAIISLRGVSRNKTIICFIAMQSYKELNL